jgi:hypothetical protein
MTAQILRLDLRAPRREGRRFYEYRGDARYPRLRSPLFLSRYEAQEWMQGERNRAGFRLLYLYGGTVFEEWPWKEKPERVFLDDSVLRIGGANAKQGS